MSRIVLSVWDHRISPVFESCSQLLVAETERWPFEFRVFCSFAPGEPEQNRAFRAMDTGAKTLICGAISRMYLNMIAASSMEVIPFVTGEVNDILRAYSQQMLNLESFGLPGCRKRRRRQRGRGRGSW